MQWSDNGSKASAATNRRGKKNLRCRPRVEVLERRMLLAHDLGFSDLPGHHLDVNRDSRVSPLDALITINAVNAARSQSVQPPPELDVTGDGHVNFLDVDAIVSELTRSNRFSELPDPQRSGSVGAHGAPNATLNHLSSANPTETYPRSIWLSDAETNGNSLAETPSAREHGKILPLRFSDTSSSGEESSGDSDAFVGPRQRLQTAFSKDGPVDVAVLDEIFADAEGVGHGGGVDRASVQESSSGGRPFVSIDATDPYAYEQGADPGEFTITRDGGSGGTTDLTVHLSVGGTATEGSDFKSISKSVTIPAGDPEVTFLVTPIDDDVIGEGMETVVVKIEPDQSGQSYTRDVFCDTVTIEDNDSGGSGGSGGGLDFSVAEVHARRTAPISIEESFYRIKQDEHFDIGSAFAFELVCAQGDTSNIRWDLLKPLSATSDEVLDSGTGTSFPYTFTPSDDQSSPYVRFYDDANQNGGWDISEEVNLNSPTFIVQERKPYPIDVDVSSAIMDQPNFAKVESLLNGAENVLLRKDSYYDARSAVDFVLGVRTEFTATDSDGARPDPVQDEADRRKHYDADAHIVLVHDLKPDGKLGYAIVGDWHQIIVEYSGHSDELRHVTIAHEIGHGVGLEHPGHYHPQIMNTHISEDNVEQTLGDADTYD